MTTPTYLLAIAIGPVQDFIAASRKSRDLFYGSELLSSISREAADYLFGRSDTELIFPAPESLIDRHSVANKILVQTSAHPASLAESARESANAELMKRWSAILPTIQDTKAFPVGAVDYELGEQQLEDFLEWYAAWVSYDPAENDAYSKARIRVDRLLAGRKALRDFLPAHGRDMRPKSSLDGSRETVVNASDHPAVAQRLRLKRGEQLDGVSLIKRLEGEHRFVSTSRVAIDPFIRAVSLHSDEKIALLQELEDHARHLANTDLVERFDRDQTRTHHYDVFPFDTQLFYELSKQTAVRQLDSRKPIEADSNSEHVSLRYAKEVQAVSRFVDLVGELKDGAMVPPAYFAVLRADGDKMGATINDLKCIEHHQNLSFHLGKFAKEAENIVKKHYGASIFTGGDDVLAFLPIDTALPCADALRLSFQATMKEALSSRNYPADDDRKSRRERLPTLSVGIAFGHFADHLQSLLDRSMKAERAAKQPRNALAVSLSAHSGGGDERVVVHLWEENPVRNRWAVALDCHRLDQAGLEGGLPGGTAYELATLHREIVEANTAGVFNPEDEETDTIFNDTFLKNHTIMETERILKRKRAQGGSEEVSPATIDPILSRMKKARDSDTTLNVLRTMIDELLIARRIFPWLMDPKSGAIDLWQGALHPLTNIANQTELEDHDATAD